MACRLSDEDFEDAFSEEEPTEEATETVAEQALEARDWGSLPPAEWGECIGKSVPPPGKSWPLGFCLGCKGTMRDLETGGSCVICGGTGKLPDAIVGAKTGAKWSRPPAKTTSKPSNGGKWLKGAPAKFNVRYGSDGRISRDVDYVVGGVTWTSGPPVEGAKYVSARVFLVAKSRSRSGTLVTGKTVTLISAFVSRRADALRVAEKIAREVEGGSDPGSYPWRIELSYRTRGSK